MSQPAFSDDKPTNGLEEYRAIPHSLTRLLVILISGAFAILLVWALQPAKHFGDGENHPAVGQALDGLQLAHLVGDDSPMTQERLRDKVVLINFWGTWCPPCRLEFPELVKINERLKSDRDFRFIPVSCGPGGADVETEQLRAESEAYIAKLDKDLAVYSDPRAGARLSVVKAAQLSGFSFPTTILLDRDGTIRALWSGYRPGVEKEMEAAIKRLL